MPGARLSWHLTLSELVGIALGLSGYAAKQKAPPLNLASVMNSLGNFCCHPPTKKKKTRMEVKQGWCRPGRGAPRGKKPDKKLLKYGRGLGQDCPESAIKLASLIRSPALWAEIPTVCMHWSFWVLWMCHKACLQHVGRGKGWCWASVPWRRLTFADKWDLLQAVCHILVNIQSSVLQRESHSGCYLKFQFGCQVFFLLEKKWWGWSGEGGGI